MQIYTVNFSTTILASSHETAAKKVAEGLKHNKYSELYLIVERNTDLFIEFVDVRLSDLAP